MTKNLLAVGLDLGGTKIKAALVSQDGRVLASLKRETHAHSTVPEMVERLTTFIESLTAREGVPWSQIAGIGVGVPGTVRSETGMITLAPNLNWKNVPLAKKLSVHFKKPVFINNDANLAALGESWQGAGRNATHLVLFTLGTGVGGGILLEGKLYQGAWGSAGEFGHIPIHHKGLICSCGGRGCLELYASAKFLRRQGEKLFKKKIQSAITQQGIELFRQDPGQVIFTAAQQKDKEALQIFREFGENLGIGIAAVVNILNPHLVIIGGGISKAWKFFQGGMNRQIPYHIFPTAQEGLEIRPAQLGDYAGVIGAAALVFGIGR